MTRHISFSRGTEKRQMLLDPFLLASCLLSIKALSVAAL